MARERVGAGDGAREELAEPASLASVALAAECQEEASYKRRTLDKATVRTLLEGFCSSSGSGVMVKAGGNAPRFPPRGGFVVVVVVTDKECGTPSGTSCRPAAAQGAARQSIRGGKIQARVAQTRIFPAGKAARSCGQYAVVKMRSVVLMERTLRLS